MFWKTASAQRPSRMLERSALLWSLRALAPSPARHGIGQSKQSPLVGTGPWVWCSVCGARTKARKHNLRYCKLKQLAAGQDLNGRQPVDTYEVKRLRTAAVEEWRLQLGASVDPG